MLEYMLIRGISHKHLKNSNRKTKSRDNVRKRAFPFASCFDKDLHVLMWTNGRCIWEAEKNQWYLFVVITHIAWLEKYCLICGGGGRGGQMFDISCFRVMPLNNAQNNNLLCHTIIISSSILYIRLTDFFEILKPAFDGWNTGQVLIVEISDICCLSLN
jgi:hypothetical protein